MPPNKRQDTKRWIRCCIPLFRLPHHPGYCLGMENPIVPTKPANTQLSKWRRKKKVFVFFFLENKMPVLLATMWSFFSLKGKPPFLSSLRKLYAIKNNHRTENQICNTFCKYIFVFLYFFFFFFFSLFIWLFNWWWLLLGPLVFETYEREIVSPLLYFLMFVSLHTLHFEPSCFSFTIYANGRYI